MDDPKPDPAALRPPWRRALWLACGIVALLLGMAGLVLPLLPTTPFVLLAALCFTRSSPRWEAWLLGHPRWGPMVRDWRATRAIPWRAKLLAWSMMVISASWAAWTLPGPWRWLPAMFCAVVALWMARLPTRR